MQTGPNTSSHETFSSGAGVRDHGRAQQLSVQLAAGEDLGAGRAGLLDPGEHPVACVAVDQRADVGGLVRRVADDERLHLGQEAAEQVVVAGAVHVDPLDGDAALPGEREGVRGELRGRVVEVAVRLDDHRASRSRARA